MKKLTTCTLVALLLAPLAALQAEVNGPLQKGFMEPPPESRPELFWDWMHDLVTRDGITHDLESMKRVGLSGAMIMLVGGVDADFDPTHKMPKPVKCMSPEFFEHWKFAAEEANRLGLTLISQCGPGWCHSGGPWIKPEQAVQHLAWSEVQITGPAPGTQLVLATPPDFTHDVAVVAFPRRAGEIRPQDVVELTARMKEGAVTWDVPAGNWTVRRYALSNAKAYNRVAPTAGRGLECDKLSKEAVKVMFDGMVGRFIQDSPQLAGKSILGMEADSWEVGHPEWSPGFREEFKTRLGYDPVPWLVGFKGPTTARVGSGDLGERFAYDVNLTLVNCFADNFFSYLTELCGKHGMEFMTEPYTGPFDPVRCGGRTARPMGEVWASGECMHTVRWAASAAHTYGRKLAGAETFTGRWSDGAWAIDPYALKRIGDLSFCNGLNKITMHGSALQPWGDKVKPGMQMGFWGTMFGPGQTWWEPGREWISYLSRCQFLLQQGEFVADILGVFPTMNWGGSMPDGLHKLYNYDLCSEETLEKLDFKDGRFVLPDGMAYRVLLLPPSRGKMDPAILRRVLALVEKGGTVICRDKPAASPSMKNFPACDEEVKQLVDRLWGQCDGKSVMENRCGKGRLVWMNAWSDSGDPEPRWIVQRRPAPALYNRADSTVAWSEGLLKILRDMGVAPDVEVRTAGGRAQVFGGKPETECGTRKGEDAVAWIHRRAGDADLYFVASQVADPMTAEMVFRVDGKIPEFWDPETGRITKPASWRVENGRIVVIVPFTPYGSMFVVFRPGAADPVLGVTKDGAPLFDGKVFRSPGACVVEADSDGRYDVEFASGRKAKTEVNGIPAPQNIEGDWTVRFPAGWGAPAETTMGLNSWTAHEDAGVRYFSGTATYVREFDVPQAFMAGGMKQFLDLGEVKNLAEVLVNGQSAGVLWKPPFRADVTGLLKPGRNLFEIKVTNLWVNRMVGDELQPDDCEWQNIRIQCNDMAGRSIKSIPDWVWTGGPRPQANRYTFTTWKFYSWSTPLLESGLLGPVTLCAAKQVELK